MRFAAVTIALLCAALTASAAAPAKRKNAHATTRRVSAHSTSRSRSTKHGKAVASHPVAMDTERATQIQTALIKSGYLSGEASGSWDAQSIAAMQKLQSDNGWQTKIVPDSRALIKLGLGPQSTHN
jgi:hypothetical protein